MWEVETNKLVLRNLSHLLFLGYFIVPQFKWYQQLGMKIHAKHCYCKSLISLKAQHFVKSFYLSETNEQEVQ